MMPFKDATAQIIELFATAFTLIPLTGPLARMFASFADCIRPTFRAYHTCRPAQFSDFAVAFLIIDQVLNVQHFHALCLFSGQLIPCFLLLQFSSLESILSQILFMKSRQQGVEALRSVLY